jgi:N-acetylneuraminic acid mutarotase
MAGLLVLLALSAGAWLLFNPAALKPSSSNNSPLPTTAPRWMADSGLPDKRSAMGVAVYDNNIYLIGGESEAGVDGTLKVFNPAAHTWKGAAAKPTPVSDCQAAVIGEKIYVPGGLTPKGQPSDVLEVYNPRLNAWEKKSNLPMPLSGYAMVAQEGSLYLFGGWDGKKVSSAVLKYDPDLDRWSERRGLSSPRTGASAVAVEGKILIIGGSDGKSALKLVQAYIPDRDAEGDDPWQDLPSLPQGRYGMSAVSMASTVYLLGGQTAPGDTGSLQPLMLQQGARSWQVFDAGGLQLGFEARAAAYGNFIHIFGGKNGGALSSTHLTYQALYTVAIPLISGSDH